MRPVEGFRVVVEAWQTLSPDRLADVYADTAYYHDPISGPLTGRDDILSYMRRSIESAESCEFDLLRTPEDSKSGAIEWVMRATFDGKPMETKGATFIETDGARIRYHRDYFDPKEMP